jgi:prepilin-type N-terminal cleavage/methylation domain-containing protein
MSKKGFTLIELLAVVAILVIMTLGVVPNLVQTYNKAKDKEYEEFIERLKESARVYAEHNIDDIEGLSEIEGTAYVTIRDIVDEGLLRLPLINPRTKESVDLNSQIKIIRISNNSFDIELFVIPD